MKKFAFFIAAVMAFSMFSFSAFAEDITGPGSKTLDLNALKGVSYTLSIPSGTKSVDITSNQAQKIGDIGLTAANFTTGSIDVEVTSTNNFALKNGSVSVGYTLSAENNSYSFNKASETLTEVKLTINDTAAATIAGTYTDTLTFTASSNGVA